MMMNPSNTYAGIEDLGLSSNKHGLVCSNPILCTGYIYLYRQVKHAKYDTL